MSNISSPASFSLQENCILACKVSHLLFNHFLSDLIGSRQQHNPLLTVHRLFCICSVFSFNCWSVLELSSDESMVIMFKNWNSKFSNCFSDSCNLVNSLDEQQFSPQNAKVSSKWESYFSKPWAQHLFGNPAYLKVVAWRRFSCSIQLDVSIAAKKGKHDWYLA